MAVFPFLLSFCLLLPKKVHVSFSNTIHDNFHPKSQGGWGDLLLLLLLLFFYAQDLYFGRRHRCCCCLCVDADLHWNHFIVVNEFLMYELLMKYQMYAYSLLYLIVDFLLVDPFEVFLLVSPPMIFFDVG